MGQPIVPYEIGKLVMITAEATNDPCLREIVWKISDFCIRRGRPFYYLAPEWVPDGFRLPDDWGLLCWTDIDETAWHEDLVDPPETLAIALAAIDSNELPCRECISLKRRLVYTQLKLEKAYEALAKCSGIAKGVLDDV